MIICRTTGDVAMKRQTKIGRSVMPANSFTCQLSRCNFSEHLVITSGNAYIVPIKINGIGALPPGGRT